MIINDHSPTVPTCGPHQVHNGGQISEVWGVLGALAEHVDLSGMDEKHLRLQAPNFEYVSNPEVRTKSHPLSMGVS